MRQVTFLLMFVAAACQPATMEMTEEQKAAIADTVNAVHAQARDAWRVPDLDLAMTYFHDSPDIRLALEGQVMHGPTTVLATVGPLFEGVASQDMTITATETVVLAPDVVCIIDQGTFAMLDSAGAVVLESPYAYTVIYVRRGGEWKALIGHESLPTPEAT